MKQFFKFVFATITGLILFLILSFFLFAFILGSAFKKEVVEVKPNSVLKIELKQPLTERSDNNPFKNINFNSFKTTSQPGLSDLIKNIEKAAKDDQIKGILLSLDNVEGGYASLRELRNALQRFKKSGKFIVSYAEYYSTKAYYLGSVADHLYVHPEGGVDFKGLYTQLMFMKGTLEKLEIEPEIIRHGKFKSAIEPFILDKMSPENKEQIAGFVNAIWQTIQTDIADSRKLSVNELEAIADSLAAENAKDALTLKLVDQLCYKDELEKIIIDRLKNADHKINYISMNRYNDVMVKSDKKFTKDRIAVVYVDGDIVSGNGDTDESGSEKIAGAIKKAREDDQVKAVVLRVNSPGGSALASDVIWREAKLVKGQKPLIVSMGNVAASGGYYISCIADTIVAQPTTITGSIGVFGLLFNAEKMLQNKLGLTFDTYKTGPYADLGLPTRALSQAEKDKLQRSVEHVYDTFVGRVAEGRNLSKETVDSLGQGRVWSATDAKRLGLVDVYGGLNDAIEIAANKAGITNYRIRELPDLKDPIQELLDEMKGEGENALMPDYLKQSLHTFRIIKKSDGKDQIQMRLPFGLMTE
jgi:protease-4